MLISLLLAAWHPSSETWARPASRQTGSWSRRASMTSSWPSSRRLSRRALCSATAWICRSIRWTTGAKGLCSKNTAGLLAGYLVLTVHFKSLISLAYFTVFLFLKWFYHRKLELKWTRLLEERRKWPELVTLHLNKSLVEVSYLRRQVFIRRRNA